MKKYYLLFLLGGSFGPAMAQDQQSKAFNLLDSIGQRSFQTTFTYHSQSPQYAMEEPLTGKIAIQGHKYRLTLPGQEVINNGQTVWTYLQDANEVQITDHDPEQEATTPWTIFTNYRQDYTFSCFDTHQANGHTYDSVELLAKDEENALSRVRITVEHTTKHIKHVEVMDNNQTLHIFSITNFVYDLTFNKAFFSFNPEEHQGVEIIDMRQDATHKASHFP